MATTLVTLIVHWDINDDQEVRVVGSCGELGGGRLSAAPVMNFVSGCNALSLQGWFERESVLEYKYVVVSKDSSIEEELYCSQERNIFIDDFSVYINDGVLSPDGLELHTTKTQLWIAFGENSIADRTNCINGNFEIDHFSISLQGERGKKDTIELKYPLSAPLREYVFTATNSSEFNIVIDYIDSDAKIIGKSFAAARSFVDSGKCTWPIISTTGWDIIGYITIEYLLVTPFSHSFLDTTELNDEGRVFRKRKETLSIGHRGSGANTAKSTEGKFPELLENTILSFRNAVSLGSDYIEFDINLSGDGIPVIFHDFSIPLAIQQTIQHKQVKIPINSLLLEEFKLIASANQLTSNSKGIQHDSYPTLQELFDSFPSGVGFDIEVKYPGFEESHYCSPKYSRNEMIDRILTVVFDALEQFDREIFFSSFDPECCVLLNQKQPKYPVFFLTEGGETLYPSDPRKNSLHEAVQFCKRARLFGIVSPSSIFLNNSCDPADVQDSSLLLFTWGEQNNHPENFHAQKKQGVDGIVSDHLFNCPFPSY